MGAVLKIGEDYYIEFTARGLKYQRNGGKDKASAVRLLEEIEAKIQKGEMSIVVIDVKVDNFFKELLVRIKNEEDPKTFSRYQAAIKYFQEFIHTSHSSDCKLSEITPSVMESYRIVLLENAGDRKSADLNLTLYLLRDVFDRAINYGHINDNPTYHTRLIVKPDQKIPQTLSDDDVAGLYSGLSSSAKNIVDVILRTGLEAHELSCLKWTNVDLEDNCFKIVSTPDSLCRERQIPMDREVMAIICRLRDQKNAHKEYVFNDDAGQKLGESEISEYCTKAGANIGIDHSMVRSVFRNTFARSVLNKGVSLIGLHKLLGLRDIACVMQYEGFLVKS